MTQLNEVSRNSEARMLADVNGSLATAERVLAYAYGTLGDMIRPSRDASGSPFGTPDKKMKAELFKLEKAANIALGNLKKFAGSI